MSGGIMITAPESNKGKTLITFGLIAAAKKRGLSVRSFKTGPDYIDTLYHKKISGTDCINLDPFFLEDFAASGGIKEVFNSYARGFDIAVIEGAMGYFSGIYLQEPRASAYTVAKLTQVSAIMVINKEDIAEKGEDFINEYLKKYLEHSADSYMKGFIINKIQKEEYDKLKSKIEKNTGLKALGYIPYQKEFEIPSRHLGLYLPEESNILTTSLQLAEIMEKTLEVEYIIKAAGINDSDFNEDGTAYGANRAAQKINLAFACDEAFLFIYKENIRILEEKGFNIIYFSPLKDKKLPENIKCIWLPGGYPEIYAKELAENKAMLACIKLAADSGINIVAECGGFIYLHDELEGKDGIVYSGAGIIKGRASAGKRLLRFGYIEVSACKDTLLLRAGEKCKSHEFHYWDSNNTNYSCRAVKANKSKAWDCIYSDKNIFAGFPHIYLGSNEKMVENLYAACINQEIGTALLREKK